MLKSTKFPGQPVFSQVISFIPSGLVSKIASEHDSDRYYKKFKTHAHLITMLYAVMSGLQSLSELFTGLEAFGQKLRHLGLAHFPRKSTVSDGNKDRSSEVFGAIYQALLRKYFPRSPDSREKKKWLDGLYIVDSTTISLFKEILKCVGRKPVSGKRKGGIKVHTVIQLGDLMPRFIRFSAASRHDRRFLKHVKFDAGALVTFDKAYNDYGMFAGWTQKGVDFVTRMKKNAVYEVEQTHKVGENESGKVLKDQTVLLTYGKDKKQLRVRRVEYYDEKNDKVLVFLSNIFSMSADEVAGIYEKRWEIECLFKRLKQNFPLKYFLGDNQNAIEIQIWCSLIANLIYSVIKKGLKRKWAFSNICSMIRLHLPNYIHLIQFLNNPTQPLNKHPKPALQPQLFET